MGVKIGKAEFSAHEFVLLILCLLFFSLLFFGSWAFSTVGKIFPLTIGGIGMVLVLLYLISGFLPARFYNAMKKDTDFRLFGWMPERDEIKKDDTSTKTQNEPVRTFRFEMTYLVLVLFFCFILFAYLFGFYIATFVFTLVYLLVYSKDSFSNAKGIVSSILLILVLLGSVSIFDLSFGYDFMKGAAFKFLD